MRRQVGHGVIGRVVRAAVAVGIVGGLVAGCGAGPSRLGSAAIIGDTVLPASVVKERVQYGLSRTDVVERLQTQAGVGPDELARDIVTQGVVHELARRAAADAGIVVTDADVDAEFAARGGAEAADQTPFMVPVLKERLHDDLVRQRLAAAQVDKLAVVLDVVAAPTAAEAERTTRALVAGGAQAAEVFAAHPDAARAVEFRASDHPELATTVPFGTPAGGGGWYQESPGVWIAFRVVDRKLDAPAEGRRADVVPQLTEADLAAIGRRLLQPIATRTGVVVNPRYGVWDPVTMRVIDPDNVAGMVLAPSAP